MSVRSLGQLTLDLVAKTSSFTGPMDKASKQVERQFKKLERDGKAAAKSLGLITAAAAAAAGGLYMYAKAGMDNIDANAKLARSLDGTIDGLRAVQLAASDSGLDGMEASLNRMNRRLGAVEMNGGPALKTVQRLNLDLQRMQGMDVDEKLAYIADQIKATGMSSQEAARHLQQLGFEQRGAAELFVRGGDAIRGAREEMEAYGLSISMVDAAAIESANDAISRLGLVSESAQNALAIRLAPALNDIADALNDITKAFHAGEYDTHLRVIQGLATTSAGAAAAYATYRAAVNLATIAQWKFNAAARANPIGMLITAAGIAVGALYAFREELIGSAQASERVANRVDDLTNAINTNSEAAVRSQLVNLTGQMFDLERQAIAARARIDEVTQSSASRSGSLGIAPGNTGEQARAYQELARLVEEQEAVNQSADRLRGIMQALRTEGTTPTANSVRDLSEVSSEAARQAEQLERAYESLLDRLYPIEASQRRFREEMELLDLAAQAGKVHDLADAQERLRESFGSDQDWQSAYGFDGMGGEGEKGGYWDRWLEGAENAFTDFDQMAANTAENFQRQFGNAFESMIFDSQSLGDAVHGMADSMLRSVVNALGQMAAQWIAYQGVQIALGKTAESAAVASAAATGSSVAAAYAPAAAMASLASFGANSAPAMAGIAATSAMAKSMSLMGMAHDGIDSIPREGTWLLDKGERVLNAPQASKLDRFLDQQQAQDRRRDGGGVTVNIIENPERAGQRETTVNADGREEESLFVADIYGDGPRSRAIQNAFGLQRRGR